MRDLGGARIITRADGSYIYDGEGNAILDGMAGLWCVQVGYGRKELADAAYDQMLELPYYNTFFKTATPPTIQLASKISELLGGNLSHVFFNTSGSEAIDRSEEHTSELQSLMRISYAVFCLKKKKHINTKPHITYI